MFTGIIQKIGTLTQVEPAGESTRIQVATGFLDLALGESVAINGVCLTVTEFNALGDAAFFVSPETLFKSNLRSLKTSSIVNLERAVTLNTRLSGHLVQGHVDGMGKLVEIQERAESYQVRFEIPCTLARYCVEKGSIAINGVSLTINFLERPSADIAFVGITLIPHTWIHTQFSKIQVGDAVNIEVDVLAKYVESLSKNYV